ncbi:unnamed protein product [Ceutorhynchus assimilis]|uniref:Propionyl-CoA carboxylase n=1 Tax=Ceutorhynchus assimilis TaxID=467358 RepID=A0A9N9MWV6_9CUCU|nr:unnamed protein product [Ceutorhynchus assimilis]
MAFKNNSKLFSKLCSCCGKANVHFGKHKRSQHTTGAIIDPNNEAIFKKVLIANRGEIACRIIRTAKRMGIKTVAVYSVADSQARHVKMADEAVFIGPSSATESYLNIDKIMEAIKQTNADAVHPGYGFLSENTEFVRILESRENVAFIGPSAEVISKMGDKLESKRTAMDAGVNVIPGFDQIVTDAEHCVQIARVVGYPVMIKASAGGGGKGMRIARNDHEVREGFLLSTQEAESSFGDSRMLVEKFIENPRHIEIQILGDQYGNVIYLNERECSIQRRNQKVIEEAPSVFLDTTTRQKMGEQSVSLCKKLNYSNAGTVEFLVDQKRNFYFLEMNTRLQVEHPITECITGIDLVHQMFRLAKGHKLNIKQEDVEINGWAIESRVYAEDPYKNFGLPSIGKLYKYKEPNGIPGVRCDSGVEEGSKITMHYDPLICKLVCHGKTRKEAIEISKQALDSYVIRGIEHNIPFLRDILTQQKFIEGNISTDYLPQVYPEGFQGITLGVRDRHKLVAVAGALYATNELRSRSFINIPDFKIRSGKAEREKWKLFIRFDDNEEVYVNVAQTNGQFRIEVAANVFCVDKNEINLSSPIMELTVNGTGNVVQLLSWNASGEYQIIFNGNNYKFYILTEQASNYLNLMPKKLKKVKLNKICAPMAGLVKLIFCSVGDKVIEGQELLVIESMKMQNFIVAQSNGTIKYVNFNIGDTVTNGDVLVELE